LSSFLFQADGVGTVHNTRRSPREWLLLVLSAETPWKCKNKQDFPFFPKIPAGGPVFPIFRPVGEEKMEMGI
jgi:hypothetical protein